MELIPIIKYALTGISGISFVVVVFSYIMYKIKNGNQSDSAEMPQDNRSNYQNNLQSNFPQTVMLQPIHSHKEPASFVHERNFQYNKVSVKKPVQRFKVLNTQQEPVLEAKHYQPQNTNYSFEQPSTRQSFNIYSNYSASSSEPLRKFGI